MPLMHIYAKCANTTGTRWCFCCIYIHMIYIFDILTIFVYFRPLFGGRIPS